MTTRNDQKIQRREQILNIALDEFIKKGFFGTSTNAIAKRCKMSSGLMFHYFKSKDALYLTLLEKGAKGLGALSEVSNETSSPLEIFKNMATFILNSFREFPESLKLFVFIKQAMFTDLPFKEAEKVIQNMNLIETLADLIIAGQKTGEIICGNPYAMTTLFFSSLQGVAEMAAKYPQLPLPEPAWFTAFLINKQ